jgi:2-desacetyl-2-hydroxyethyl bacteriochlorophyllide A dehydrogenase
MRIERLLFTGPRRAEIVQADLKDDPPERHEVILRTWYSAISPGTELAHFAGGQTLGHGMGKDGLYPGYAAVGEVLDAGDEAPVHRGDLVLAHTRHQSVVRFDSSVTICARLPTGLAPEHAPLARLAQVGAVSIRLMAGRPGDVAAVVGLGLVGILAAQLLAVAGLHVKGIEPLPQRRAIASRLGIEAHAPDATDDLRNHCRVVLECSGRERGLLTALDMAAYHGEVFLVGAAWQREGAVVAADVVRPVFNKYLALRSGWEWQIPRMGDGPRGSVAAVTAWVLDCMRAGTLRVDELITDRVLPREAPAAYIELLDHPTEHLGVIINWRENGEAPRMGADH